MLSIIDEMKELTISGREEDPEIDPKFAIGELARFHWKKNIIPEEMTITEFNKYCGNAFEKRCSIILDPSAKRQTTLTVDIVSGQEDNWKEDTENIYAITRNGKIMKIGGTRTGMKKRWNSYLCGYCVPQRIQKKTGKPFPGKMSVTNAHLYHTIEDSLLEGDEWSFYTWMLPPSTFTRTMPDGTVSVIKAQTYHAYESWAIEQFKSLTEHIPQLCNNSDPLYR